MAPHRPSHRALAASIPAFASSTGFLPIAARHTFSSTPATYAYNKPTLPPHEAHLPVPLPATKLDIPPYPHGPSQTYKQSNTGLYGHSKIRFGNHVTHKAFPKFDVKTSRSWRPNVQRKRLWSEALGTHVKTKITTRVLRTIDKAGGLDEYLLGEKSARVRELGVWGWKLRWRVMQSVAVQERFERERVKLGLPAGGYVAAQRGEVEALLATEGEGVEGVEEEVQGMIEREEEFELGPGEDFMREERPRRP